MNAATVAVLPRHCIHLALVHLAFLFAFLLHFLCHSILTCFWILAAVSWEGLASRATWRNSKVAKNWKTMTKSCHKFGNILHESCLCAHIHNSMVLYSYRLVGVVSSYDAEPGVRMHACAFVSARCFWVASEEAVLPFVWIVAFDDASLEMVDEGL